MTRWCILLFTLFCVGCGSAPAPAPIYVGQIATMSGPDGRQGQMAARGIRLALDEVNRDSKLRPIVLRSVDSEGRLDAYEAQAVRLFAVQRVVGILGGATPAEVQRMDRARLPSDGAPIYMPILATTGLRTSGLSDQVFLTGIPPEEEGRFLAEYASQETSATAIVVADGSSDSARAAAESFARLYPLKVKNPPRPKILYFGPDRKLADLKDTLMTARPRVLLFAGSRTDWNNLPVPSTNPLLLFAGDDPPRPDDLKTGEVIFRVSPFAADPEHPPSQEFMKRFHEAYQDTADVSAALAYDNMRLLADAIRKSPTTDKLRDELRKIRDFPGVTGLLSFGPNQQLRRPAFVVRVDGTLEVAVKKFGP